MPDSFLLWKAEFPKQNLISHDSHRRTNKGGNLWEGICSFEAQTHFGILQTWQKVEKEREREREQGSNC